MPPDLRRCLRQDNAVPPPGVRFDPAEFTPASSKFKDRLCGGVRIRVTDRIAFRSVLTGIALLRKILELYPEQVIFRPSTFGAGPHIHYLAGCDVFREPIPGVQEIWKRWDAECAAFRVRKEKYHLYP